MDLELKRHKTFFIVITHVVPECIGPYTQQLYCLRDLFYYPNETGQWCYLLKMTRTTAGTTIKKRMPIGSQVHWLDKMTFDYLLSLIGITL